MRYRIKLKPGILIICIDLELAWGFVFRRLFPLRENILMQGRQSIPTLLKLFQRYEIPATWAVVGHLLLSQCKRHNNIIHPEIIRPRYSWFLGDWFQFDPGSDIQHAPLWYGRDLIDDILNNPIAHDIGSHSFSHFLFGEVGLDKEAAESDFLAFDKASREIGFKAVSFVYPAHSVGHREMLPRFGFKIYRGNTLEPFIEYWPPLRKFLRFWIHSCAIAPLPADPQIEEDGLIHLPASMHFALKNGLSGFFITQEALARRAKRGILHTSRKGGVFTLYFHDHNLGFDPVAHLAALENVLEFASNLRNKGVLRIMTMRELANMIIYETRYGL